MKPFTTEVLLRAAEAVLVQEISSLKGYNDPCRLPLHCMCWAITEFDEPPGSIQFYSTRVMNAMRPFKPDEVVPNGSTGGAYWWPERNQQSQEERCLMLCFLANAPDDIWE